MDYTKCKIPHRAVTRIKWVILVHTSICSLRSKCDQRTHSKGSIDVILGSYKCMDAMQCTWTAACRLGLSVLRICQPQKLHYLENELLHCSLLPNEVTSSCFYQWEKWLSGVSLIYRNVWGGTRGLLWKLFPLFMSTHMLISFRVLLLLFSPAQGSEMF